MKRIILKQDCWIKNNKSLDILDLNAPAEAKLKCNKSFNS